MDVRRGFRPRIRTSHVVAGAALVLVTTGGATAAGIITGKDIKDGSVSTKDIKNGSLVLKDFKASERGKLVGPAGPAGTSGATGANGANGANGTNGAPGTPGAPGASAFAPPPSGTVIKGGGILSTEVNAANVGIRSYAPVPFTPAQPLRETPTATRNLWLGATPAGPVQAGQVNTTSCGGTADAPAPAAGQMCVYLDGVSNTASIALFAGADLGADGADTGGFYVYGSSVAAGSMTVRYVWAYKAP